MEEYTKKLLINMAVNRFWFKGRGILVVPLFIPAMVIAFGLFFLVETYIGLPTNGAMAIVFMGLVLIIWGLLTWLVGRDFIRKDGQRVEIDLGNWFLFLKMKHAGLVFMALGIGVVIYGSLEAASIIDIFPS